MKLKLFPALALACGVMLAGAAHAQKAELTHADKEFIENATHNGNAEIESSKVALQRARSPQVKQFAQHMIDDHAKAGAELAAIAKAKGVTPPNGPSAMQIAKIKLLSTAEGNDFDTKYSQSMGVDAHRSTVNLFEKASTELKDPDLKAFATKTLPKLREHLQMAEKLPGAAR